MDKLSNINTVIFDLGGTLLHINPAVFEKQIKEYIPDYSIPYNFQDLDIKAKTEFSAQKTQRQIIHDYFYKILEELNLDKKIADKVIVKLINSDKHSAVSIWNKPDKYAFDILNYLKEKYTLALISNNSGNAKKQLKNVKLDGFFNLIVDSQIIGVEKPNPKIFLYTAEKLNTKPQNCVYVGDIYEWDGVGATNAGMLSILVHSPKKYDDVVKNNKKIIKINELSEIKNLL